MTNCKYSYNILILQTTGALLFCVCYQSAVPKEITFKGFMQTYFACFTEFWGFFSRFYSGHFVSTLSIKDLAVGWVTVWGTLEKACFASYFIALNVLGRWQADSFLHLLDGSSILLTGAWPASHADVLGQKGGSSFSSPYFSF